jgi:hypothetical protein
MMMSLDLLARLRTTTVVVAALCVTLEIHGHDLAEKGEGLGPGLAVA